jgi:hypothetical protein
MALVVRDIVLLHELLAKIKSLDIGYVKYHYIIVVTLERNFGIGLRLTQYYNERCV